jgi:RHS repeat-associated protein
MSTRQLTDSTEAITDTYVFDAFGIELSRTGTTENNHMYTGEQYDPNIGFYYLRARMYDPAIGRFRSADRVDGALFDPVTLHRYVYAANNPVGHVDPSGEFSSFIEISAATSIYQIMWSYNLTLLGILIEVEEIDNSTLRAAYATQDRALRLLAMSNGAEIAWNALVLARQEIAAGYFMIARSIARNYSKFFVSIAIPWKVKIGPLAWKTHDLVVGILQDPRQYRTYIPLIVELKEWEGILQYTGELANELATGTSRKTVVANRLKNLLDVLGKKYIP